MYTCNVHAHVYMYTCIHVCVHIQVKHMLGSSAEAQSNIEANTQIANLCDLLERIWGHGLKKREVDSSTPQSHTH